MLTERYTVVLFGINTRYYTNEYVAHIWEKSANTEYQNSGIFVTARIDTNRLVCGEIRGCTLGETAFVIIAVRNPAESLIQQEFYDSFKNVLNYVRQDLGQPNMTIAIDEVDYFYFTQS